MRMEGWFLDCWRSDDAIACWIKTTDRDSVVRIPLSMTVYAKPYPTLIRWLEHEGIGYGHVRRCEYDGSEHRLIAIRAPVRGFERFVDRLERAGGYRTPLFDADIGPEQRFMIERELYAGCPVRVRDGSIGPSEGVPMPALRVRHYSFSFDTPIHGRANKVVSLRGDANAAGDERSVLDAFAHEIERDDPDVLVIENAYVAVPIIDARMRALGIPPPFHRFDPRPIDAREGRSLFRYGSVVWRDAAVKLRGRILLDPHASENDIEGLVELSRLSGAPIQTIASRSPGTVFQYAIVRDLVRAGRVVSHKRKPLGEPMSMTDLVRSDRAGLSFDPIVGFHRDVVELDYEAMFPNLMVQKNISAEKIGRGAFAPDVPVRVDQSGESIVSRSMRPFVELRARYKYGNERERARAKALKGVLVSANGYLRFREFKLGIPTSHVALCAWSREYLLRAKELAEDDGYRLVHGIVDSIYLSGSMDSGRIAQLQERVGSETGLRLAREGVFRWIVFLPSKTNAARPVITRFFGVFSDGSVKLRGIEARQKSTPRIVAMIQRALVEYLGRFETEEAIRDAIPIIAGDLARIVSRLDRIERSLLSCSITLSKSAYRTNSLGRQVLLAAHRAGIDAKPGRRVRYVHTVHGIRLDPDPSPIDRDAYRRLIVRAVSTITEPFGYDHLSVSGWISRSVQHRLFDPFGSGTGTLLPLLAGSIEPIVQHVRS